LLGGLRIGETYEIGGCEPAGMLKRIKICCDGRLDCCHKREIGSCMRCLRLSPSRDKGETRPGGRILLCKNIETATHAPNSVPLRVDILDPSSISDAVLTDSSAMVVDEDDAGSRGECSLAALSRTAIAGNLSRGNHDIAHGVHVDAVLSR